jgi:predicted DNA-binding antitoxin AbrB/MazE fold protein
MEKTRAVIGGVVKGGVIIPQEDIKLPEGTYVNIIILSIPPELQAEIDAWDLASGEDLIEFEKMLLLEEEK